MQPRPSGNRLVQVSRTESLGRPEGIGLDPPRLLLMVDSLRVTEDTLHAMLLQTHILPFKRLCVFDSITLTSVLSPIQPKSVNRR